MEKRRKINPSLFFLIITLLLFNCSSGQVGIGKAMNEIAERNFEKIYKDDFKQYENDFGNDEEFKEMNRLSAENSFASRMKLRRAIFQTVKVDSLTNIVLIERKFSAYGGPSTKTFLFSDKGVYYSYETVGKDSEPITKKIDIADDSITSDILELHNYFLSELKNELNKEVFSKSYSRYYITHLHNNRLNYYVTSTSDIGNDLEVKLYESKKL